ncbi:MAG: twin-arginine translocase subunit TatC [Saprospiraceae bacterium]|nr:twin-arginine translocase subunit TatC [Saprospiraceae bacterium]
MTEAKDKDMSFLEHLEELRWHIIRSFIGIIVIAVGVFLAKDFIFNEIILKPTSNDFITYRWICKKFEPLCFGPGEVTVFTKELGEQFIIHLKVSFWFGLIVAFPYVFYEVWKFISPGLYSQEKQATRGIVFICTFLFLTGVAFGYFVISPFAISFLSNYQVSEMVSDSFTLSSIVNYMTMFTIPTGLVFQLPVAVYFLSKLGLVTPAWMKQYRRHAFVIILVLAAIITPPDMITQLLIGIPLYFLYEISIWISARVEKKRNND